MLLSYREATELSSAVLTGWILLSLSVLISFLIYVNGVDPNAKHDGDFVNPAFSEQFKAKEMKD